MFSDLITKGENKQTKYKEGPREHLEVVDTLMLMVMLVSHIYTYLQIHHFTYQLSSVSC